ncbi:MAG: phosphohistidine phosphatase SixA [Candidatus Hydrogenedentes bacterium]|nr:phosphohistidine phosphatase SixA [Candidatus Hydrogenedentota bacterium]
MRLYLMQHGEAVEKEIDPERPLSERGRRDVKHIATFLKTNNIHIPTIWHSGKTRARETAEILASHVQAQTTEHNGLNPDDDVVTAIHAIHESKVDLGIAGHLPHLALLTAELLRTKGKAAPVQFQRGGIVALHRGDDKIWQIEWMIVPELFKA